MEKFRYNLKPAQLDDADGSDACDSGDSVIVVMVAVIMVNGNGDDHLLIQCSFRYKHEEHHAAELIQLQSITTPQQMQVNRE